MRVAWLTDIHLNFVSAAQALALAERVRLAAPHAVLVGGDISEADRVFDDLDRLHDQINAGGGAYVPLYYVLGNHDYYRDSIAAVRAEARERNALSQRPAWLSELPAITLGPDLGLVGHDGWGDGGHGNALTTPVLLNDFLLIEELCLADRQVRLERLRELGAQAAVHLRRVLPQALAGHGHVVLLTHVPPFRQACWHEGRESDDDWQPFFTCRASGDAILQVMAAWPRHRLTVLCGHTHGSGEYRPTPNIRVLTGAARYRYPALQPLLEF